MPPPCPLRSTANDEFMKWMAWSRVALPSSTSPRPGPAGSPKSCSRLGRRMSADRITTEWPACDRVTARFETTRWTCPGRVGAGEAQHVAVGVLHGDQHRRPQPPERVGLGTVGGIEDGDQGGGPGAEALGERGHAGQRREADGGLDLALASRTRASSRSNTKAAARPTSRPPTMPNMLVRNGPGVDGSRGHRGGDRISPPSTGVVSSAWRATSAVRNSSLGSTLLLVGGGGADGHVVAGCLGISGSR